MDTGTTRLKPLCRALLVFELPAVGNVVTRRELHLAFDGGAHLIHKTHDIAALDIGLHHHLALGRFARDLHRPVHLREVGEQCQRHLNATRCFDQQTAQRLRRGSRRFGVTQQHRTAAVALDHLTHNLAAHGGFDHAVDVLGADHVARDVRLADIEAQIFCPESRPRKDIHRARDARHDRFDLL